MSERERLRRALDKAEENFDVTKCNELLHNITQTLFIENRCSFAEAQFIIGMLQKFIYDMHLVKPE